MSKTLNILETLQGSIDLAEFIIIELEGAERKASETDLSDYDDLLCSFEEMKESISCVLSRLK